MGVPPVRVDILMGIPGVVFDAAWSRRMEVDFDGLLVPFIARQDLIAAKARLDDHKIYWMSRC